ncbi:hypothetical protein Dimus_008890 [Dionaea muscipula]
MNTFTHVPPGFRFHPTDDELVDYYLRKKVASRKIDLDVIKDVDLYKIEPWDLQELCKIGSEEQSEWYFFSHKDKKYPTGTRTNRATKAGFWKATGRDKAIYAKQCLVGMRKTLVFYKGRAPNGQKSDWIMHEYRLETIENATPQQEEGWVVCRVFKKRITTVRKMGDDSVCWYDDQISFMPEMDTTPREILTQPYMHYHHHHHRAASFLLLPQLESPKVTSNNMSCSSSMTPPPPPPPPPNYDQSNIAVLQQAVAAGAGYHHQQAMGSANYSQDPGDQVTDWRVLDKFVASQLSQEDTPKDQSNYSDGEPADDSFEVQIMASSDHMQDLWK